MIYKAYNNESNERKVLIRVTDTTHGIILDAVDQTGFCVSHLLEIRKDGRVYMCGSVDEQLGFELDREGCILVSEEVV